MFNPSHTARSLRPICTPLATPSIAPHERKKTEIAYLRIKELVINARIGPGAPIDIGRLSRRLGIGVTPVREALARLRAENLIGNAPNRGFCARGLDGAELQALYEFSTVLLRHSLQAAGASALRARALEWAVRIEAVAPGGPPDIAAQAMARQIEGLYLRVAALSMNSIVISGVRNFNDRSHYIRVVDLLSDARRSEAAARVERFRALLRRGAVHEASELFDKTVRDKLARLPDLIEEGLTRAASPAQQQSEAARTRN